MIRLLAVFIIYFWCELLNAQSVVGDFFSVEMNQQRLGYDLIDSVLKEKKVVLLGELDHGDGTSFIVKTDLIKYLHEKLHFNTLIFEASFINCSFLWNTISDSTVFRSRIKNNIYHIWSEVEETKDLFHYVVEHYHKGTPLRIVGIDPQFSGTDNAQEFIRLLKSLLPISISESRQFFDFIHDVEVMSIWMEFPGRRDLRLSADEFAQFCEKMRIYFKENSVEHENSKLFEKYIDNVAVMGKIKRSRTDTSFELRDKQMFENIYYWINEDENEKFILWAANAHIIRKDIQLEQQGKKYYLVGLKKLGDYMYESFPNMLYSIAIASSEGATLDFTNPTKNNYLRSPGPASLEGIMGGSKTCFADLRMLEKKYGLDKYESQLLYANILCFGQWSQHFDGIIYIPEMKPSTPFR